MASIKWTMYRSLFRHLPSKKAYEMEYYREYKRRPNLDKPARFTEKLFWLNKYNELYNRALVQKIYDKYTVREYVRELGLEHILVEQYGRWDNFESIHADELPNEFILKMTQSSGQNIICSDKSNFDWDKAKELFTTWSKQQKNKEYLLSDFYYTPGEAIIADRLLKNLNGTIPNDFRVCCCNGEPRFIYCDIESVDESFNKLHEYYRELFDVNWNYLPVDFYKRPRKNKEHPITQRPDNLTEILEVAKMLSKDFIFARIDFYIIGEKIYFGEITPIPGLVGGFQQDEYDFILGDMITLPDAKVF